MISKTGILYITERIQEVWALVPELYFTQFIKDIEKKGMELFEIKELHELNDDELLRIIRILEEEFKNKIGEK